MLRFGTERKTLSYRADLGRTRAGATYAASRVALPAPGLAPPSLKPQSSGGRGREQTRRSVEQKTEPESTQGHAGPFRAAAEPRACDGERTGSNGWCWENGASRRRRPGRTPPRGAREDQRLERETWNRTAPRENAGGELLGIRLGGDFFIMAPKAKATKAKINEWATSNPKASASRGKPRTRTGHICTSRIW